MEGQKEIQSWTWGKLHIFNLILMIPPSTVGKLTYILSIYNKSYVVMPNSYWNILLAFYDNLKFWSQVTLSLSFNMCMNVQSALNLSCWEAFAVHLQKNVIVFQAVFMKLVIGGNTVLSEFRQEITTTFFLPKMFFER